MKQTSGRIRFMNCSACLHRDRDQLDAQLVQGVPYRTIANTFDLSLGAISRHKHHVQEMIQARTTEETAAHGSALLDRVTKLVGEAEEILKAAKEKNDFRGANGALGAAAKLLDLLGRLSGELHQANAAGGGLHLHKHVTNVNIGHDYTNDVEFAQMISEATRGFDPREIERLKTIVHNERATPVLTDSIQSR
jgi:hypothetical protein